MSFLRLARPSASAVRMCASACLPRVSQWSAAVPATAVRSFRSTSAVAGGHAHHDDSHGTDFLSRENVIRRVQMVVGGVDKVDKTKLKDLNSSFKSLGLDSLDEVEVVMMLEDEFVIDIQDEVASNILTLQDAVNYISNHPFAANDEVHH